MLSTLLSKAALVVLPTACGPLVPLLVPVVSYVITKRQIDIHITLR